MVSTLFSYNTVQVEVLAIVAPDAQFQSASQLQDGLLFCAASAYAKWPRPELDGEGTVAIEHLGVFLFVGSRPLQALAHTLDIAREELRLIGISVGRRLDEVHADSGHSSSRAVADVAGDGAASLREAGRDDLVGLHQLLVALRAVGLHGVFIVGTGQRTVVGIGVLRGGAVYLVGQHGPLLSTDGAAKHAEIDVVGHVGPRHLPLHDDGILFRSRRCLHLADVTARRQIAGFNVAVEIAVHIGGLYAVVHHVAH